MADTLQRHNFKGAMGADKVYDYTRNVGDLWLRRNHFALSKLMLGHTIICWDELLFHKDYASYRQLIDTEYAINEAYRESLTSNAQIYNDHLKAISQRN